MKCHCHSWYRWVWLKGRETPATATQLKSIFLFFFFFVLCLTFSEACWKTPKFVGEKKRPQNSPTLWNICIKSLSFLLFSPFHSVLRHNAFWTYFSSLSLASPFAMPPSNRCAVFWKRYRVKYMKNIGRLFLSQKYEFGNGEFRLQSFVVCFSLILISSDFFRLIGRSFVFTQCDCNTLSYALLLLLFATLLLPLFTTAIGIFSSVRTFLSGKMLNHEIWNSPFLCVCFSSSESHSWGRVCFFIFLYNVYVYGVETLSVRPNENRRFLFVFFVFLVTQNNGISFLFFSTTTIAKRLIEAKNSLKMHS